MPKSIDDVLTEDDSAYDRFATARLPRIRQELRDEHARLEALLPDLTSDTIDAHPQRRTTVERISAIEAEMDDDVVEVKLHGIGHRAWADLLRKHPPTKEQRNAPYNEETFASAAIAASLDPPRTVEWVEKLQSQRWFNEECWAELWGKCLQVNVVDPAPKSLAASLHRLSDASSKRLTTTESPARSSSVAP